MLQHALQILLVALDYLHKNNVVHTGKNPPIMYNAIIVVFDSWSIHRYLPE